MKLCPTCKNKYGDDANFCPREECAGEQGPQRLNPLPDEPAARFVPVSRLGGGASGEVWQASDAQSEGAVAYKIVAPEVLPNATAMERAQRELRQLQRTSNVRIVKVIDFGKTAEGRLFIASELAGGEPLDQVVAKSGTFPLDRAKRIVAQIGEALLEAQKVGVVHRDLSAKNILVSGDDEARVINFAIARPLTDTLFGVPEYMSPEQADGKLIDQRSNTYSLGALLYFMLTGHPPHIGATPQATIEAVQKGEITPPSIKRGEGLTAEVDRIVLKALEKNSSRRPLTMRQFLTDVSGLIVTEQQQVGPGGGGASAGKDAGFARTMMFAGGATEVQKLVAQAIAARQAAGNGTSPAEPAPASAAPVAGTPSPESGPVRTSTPSPASVPAEPHSGATPSPAHRPSHGAAIAATMIAMPAAKIVMPGSSPPGGTPGPASHPAMGHTPPLAGAGAPGTDAANFRETLWFKKGDVDQMVADARAKVAAMASANATARKTTTGVPEGELPTEDAKPLEDRYVDDGTVTVDDRKKFSLGSGSGRTSGKMRGGAVPGERMSESEILDEIGGGKRMVIIGVAAAVVIALVAVIVVSVKGKGKESTPAAENTAAAPATPPAAAPPAPVPVEKSAEARPAAPAAPAKAPVAGAPEERPEAVAKPNPPKKKMSAKKKAAAAAKKEAQSGKKKR